MKLWPLAAPGTFSAQSVIQRPRLRIATATLTAGAETPMHSHPYHDQFIVLVEGSGTLHLGTGEARGMGANAAIIIPAGLSHRFVSHQETHMITVCLGDEGYETRHMRRQPIRAWFHQGLYYLQGSAIRLAFELPWTATNQYGLLEQQIIVHDIDYIHPAVKDAPVAILPLPRRNLFERWAGFKNKKRDKVLAATYSRPNGLPSAP